MGAVERAASQKHLILPLTGAEGPVDAPAVAGGARRDRRPSYRLDARCCGALVGYPCETNRRGSRGSSPYGDEREASDIGVAEHLRDG
jgi:hypothetical protein